MTRLTLGELMRTVSRLPAWALILLVRLYQWLISPAFGPRCRFEPTCSEYFIGSLKKYGLLRGVPRGLWRILRCNPWNPGGHDPP